MEQQILEILQGIVKRMDRFEDNLQTMQGDMKTMQGKVDNLENNLKAFRAGQQEQTIILGRLEELARVNEAKTDNQMFDHAELAGRVSTVEDTLIQVGTILTTPQKKAQ